VSRLLSGKCITPILQFFNRHHFRTQTGVDRAALDWALEHGVPCGGCCPEGRKAEDGPIDPKYPLKETPSVTYVQRTEWNVRDSDATIEGWKNGRMEACYRFFSTINWRSKKTVEFAA
jgi:hypothetical protein